MNDINQSKLNKMKCGTIIKIFMVIAFFLQIIACSSYFVFYSNWAGFRFLSPSAGVIIKMLLAFIPYLLLFIYVIACHKKAAVLVPIAFIIFAANVGYYILNYNAGDYYSTNEIFLMVIEIVACVFAIISGFMSFKGAAAKTFIIIAMSLLLLDSLVVINNVLPILDYYIAIEEPFYITRYFAYIMSPIFLYISVLILGASNTLRPDAVAPACVPDPVPACDSPAAEGNLSPSSALRILRQKFEKGLINDEEYKKQRADIISKL